MKWIHGEKQFHAGYYRYVLNAGNWHIMQKWAYTYHKSVSLGAGTTVFQIEMGDAMKKVLKHRRYKEH